MKHKQCISNTLQSKLLSYKKAANNQHLRKRIYFVPRLGGTTDIRIFCAYLYGDTSRMCHEVSFFYTIRSNYIGAYTLW